MLKYYIRRNLLVTHFKFQKQTNFKTVFKYKNVNVNRLHKQEVTVCWLNTKTCFHIGGQLQMLQLSTLSLPMRSIRSDLKNIYFLLKFLCYNIMTAPKKCNKIYSLYHNYTFSLILELTFLNIILFYNFLTDVLILILVTSYFILIKFISIKW